MIKIASSKSPLWQNCFCRVLGLSILVTHCFNFPLYSQKSFSPDKFSNEEKSALIKATKPSKKLKIYLNIVSNRLKKFETLAKKCDEDPATKYLKGYHLALNQADILVSKEDANSKNSKKLLEKLLKATDDISFSLLTKLEKIPQDCRPLVQSALDVCQRINGAVEVQLLRAENF
ncbi:MAG: hypothetical protein MK025_04420 [Acidobacteriia bacterium]|nr:hypothetical protein [Terriglobia bacterium]